MTLALDTLALGSYLLDWLFGADRSPLDNAVIGGSLAIIFGVVIG